MGLPKCLQLSQRTSFISMITLTATFFLVEIIVGYATNSMALVADSFHMLSDVVSLFVGFIALRYSKAGKQTARYTFGWARAEVLGALVNAVFLVALCFSIFVEALKRIIVSEKIENPQLVLITGGIGLFVNLIGLFLFHQHGHSHGGGGHGHSHGGGGHSHSDGGGGHSHGNSKCKKKKKDDSKSIHKHKHKYLEVNENKTSNDDAYQEVRQANCNGEGTQLMEDNGTHILPKTEKQPKSSAQLNIRGVYLHVLGDALGSVIVMISALIILFADGKWTEYVDPGMSILLVLIILKTSIPLLKESSMILMQTVPTHLKIQEMQDRLIDQIPGVVSVHEFHIWQLAGSKIIASAHVQCKTLADYMAIANQLKEFFHNEGIHSTTIQPEFIERPEISDTTTDSGLDDHEVSKDCILECDQDCADRMCCISEPLLPKEPKDSGKKNSKKEPSCKPDTEINILTESNTFPSATENSTVSA